MMNIFEEIEKHGSQLAAAKALGISRGKIRWMLEKLEKQHKETLPAEALKVVPTGHIVKGISHLGKYTDPDTLESRLIWTKTAVDKAQQAESFKQYIESLGESIPPFKPIPLNEDLKHTDKFLSVFYASDKHFGEYINAEECGENFDLKIAKNLMRSSFKHLIETHRAFIPHKCLFMLNGDVLHYSGKVAETEKSKHPLDADSRQFKMINVVTDTILEVIHDLLFNYAEVHINLTAGNHDDSATHWLRTVIKHRYYNEPRLVLNPSIRDYQAFKHGKCFIAQTHGHLKGIRSPDGLALLYANRFPELWGATRYRDIFLGHYHSLKTVEVNGATLRQMRTTTPSDSYASLHGYDSLPEDTAYLYHSEFGMVQQNHFTPKMLDI